MIEINKESYQCLCHLYESLTRSEPEPSANRTRKKVSKDFQTWKISLFLGCHHVPQSWQNSSPILELVRNISHWLPLFTSKSSFEALFIFKGTWRTWHGTWFYFDSIFKKIYIRKKYNPTKANIEYSLYSIAICGQWPCTYIFYEKPSKVHK